MSNTIPTGLVSRLEHEGVVLGNTERLNNERERKEMAEEVRRFHERIGRLENSVERLTAVVQALTDSNTNTVSQIKHMTSTLVRDLREISFMPQSMRKVVKSGGTASPKSEQAGDSVSGDDSDSNGSIGRPIDTHDVSSVASSESSRFELASTDAQGVALSFAALRAQHVGVPKVTGKTRTGLAEPHDLIRDEKHHQMTSKYDAKTVSATLYDNKLQEFYGRKNNFFLAIVFIIFRVQINMYNRLHANRKDRKSQIIVTNTVLFDSCRVIVDTFIGRIMDSLNLKLDNVRDKEMMKYLGLPDSRTKEFKTINYVNIITKIYEDNSFREPLVKIVAIGRKCKDQLPALYWRLFRAIKSQVLALDDNGAVYVDFKSKRLGEDISSASNSFPPKTPYKANLKAIAIEYYPTRNEIKESANAHEPDELDDKSDSIDHKGVMYIDHLY